jgi:hypothetical protein
MGVEELVDEARELLGALRGWGDDEWIRESHGYLPKTGSRCMRP